MRTKSLLALLAAGAGILTLFTAPTATASTAVACYDGAFGWDAGYGDSGNGDNKTKIPGNDEPYDSTVGYERVFQTTNRCRDINLKMSTFDTNYRFVAARVCYYPISGGRWCNGWTYINTGDTGWKVIGSDVLDGTNFVVEFDYNWYIAGRIAY